MQFYIIHPDPFINADTLPLYALKSVNVREGYQILCDIGHRFGVTWATQNKHYNMYHPLTRSFSHRHAFDAFMGHYVACCDAYQRRTGKTRSEIGAFRCVPVKLTYYELPLTAEAEVMHYLLTAKGDKLTDEERGRLIGMGAGR